MKNFSMFFCVLILGLCFFCNPLYAIVANEHNSYDAGDALGSFAPVAMGAARQEGVEAMYGQAAGKVMGSAASVVTSAIFNGIDWANENHTAQEAFEAGDMEAYNDHRWEMNEACAKFVAGTIATVALAAFLPASVPALAALAIAAGVGIGIDFIIEHSSTLRDWIEDKSNTSGSISTDNVSGGYNEEASGSSGGAPELKPHKVY